MSKRLEDLTGQRFVRWTVIAPAEKHKTGAAQYLCRCDCGTEKVLRRSSLTSGNTQSCGCLARERSRQRGITHGGTGSRLYRIWAGIIQRCCNENQGYEWKNYGGRGITVCEEWRNSFESFKEWAEANGYTNNLTIDRKDNDGPYAPWNCRWATVYEQSNNKRTSKRITYKGESKTVREFADEYGLAYHCLYARLKGGWDIEKALLTPSKEGKDT